MKEFEGYLNCRNYTKIHRYTQCRKVQKTKKHFQK